MARFCELLSEGIQRGEVSLKIANFNSYGCTELHDALLSNNRAVVNQAQKLEVFYTGENAEQEAVWNGGNMYRTAPAPVQKLLIDNGEEATWLRIQARYKEKVSHVYRGGKCSCNRHGHSNNKPSFFAFGHNSLTSFFAASSPASWAHYQKEHPDCCGMIDAGKDAVSMQLAVHEMEAKRARRQACENDPEKRKAAIKKTMMQRKEKRMQKKSAFHIPSQKIGWGYNEGKRKGRMSDDDDDSDTEDDDRAQESDY